MTQEPRHAGGGWPGQFAAGAAGLELLSPSHAAQAGSSNGSPNAATLVLAAALHRPGKTALLWEHGGGRSEDRSRKEWGEEGTNEPRISSN